MCCDERQFKQVLVNLVQQLKDPYRDKPGWARLTAASRSKPPK
jgi:hypothetical protein